jgi:hypothetical protein
MDDRGCSFFYYPHLAVIRSHPGVVLLFLPRHRRLGWYAITVSTTATLTSFFLSTAVLYFGAKVGANPTIKWLGLAVIGTYFLAIAVGIALGGIACVFLTRKLLSP